MFGEKTGNVKDTSLKAGAGSFGIIIDARVFTRKGVEKDSRATANEKEYETQLLKDSNDEIDIIINSGLKIILLLLDGETLNKNIIDEKGKILIFKNQILSKNNLSKINWQYFQNISISNHTILEKVDKIIKKIKKQINAIKLLFKTKIEKNKQGDELPPGIIKMIKISIAIKRKMQPGDKMAGRHGNKGVVSRVLPEEDMPYLQDGRPIDIVLNPLGVPSRMNAGQILEVNLGFAAKSIGEQLNTMLKNNIGINFIKNKILKIINKPDKINNIKSLLNNNLKKLIKKMKNGFPMSTPVFDGAKELEIRSLLKNAKCNANGKTILFNGLNGEPFDQDITVGIMYMLKLHHLVDEKIHARSTGPYSLVTQQPLGGKSQFGGQRLGEMEVWALEAYGASYALQEFLTVKSDDIIGRSRIYEAIVKGEHVLDSGTPESFNVLIKELQSLGLDIILLNKKTKED